MPTPTRSIVFALQSYLNDVLIAHVPRFWRCADELGVSWRFVVNQDDGKDEVTSAWMGALQGLGENATLLRSNDIHELRAYNLMARMFDADVTIFLQDDDIPPPICGWLRQLLLAFDEDEQLGAVGMHAGVLNSVWSNASSLCHPLRRTPSRYVVQADLAPMAVRRSALNFTHEETEAADDNDNDGMGIGGHVREQSGHNSRGACRAWPVRRARV